MSETQEPEKKRVTVPNLLEAVAIVLVIQLAALGITYQNLPTYVNFVATSGYTYAPLGTSSAGSAGNAIILVLVVFASTLALVWVLRRKRVMSFRVLIFASVSLSAFLLTLTTVDDIIWRYVPPVLELPIDAAASLTVVVLIGYTIFVKSNPWLSDAILAFVGAEVGSFFASTLPPLTALALPVVFSVYDIYAVFRGPLKQLIGMAPGVALQGMSIRAGEFTLGLGDIVFYTMLPSLALFYLSPLVSLVTIFTIDAGVIATLFLLSKKRLLPGLPIPMVLGVALLAIFLL
ncbi:MAG: presenilin [Nitrososphaerales archaeon]|nr:presenilin [Nitrososphaerales archaeon]